MASSNQSREELRLKDTGLIVTGGGRGIGRAIALMLCDLGARIMLVARSTNELRRVEAESKGAAFAFPCDITKAEAAEAIVGAALKRFGKLDALIHSAGVITQETMDRTALEDLDNMYFANVRAPYALTKAALPALKAAQGQIVFINSTVTRATNLGGRGAFAASQLALRAIADSVRDEVNGDGVRVISVISGTTSTPRLDRLGWRDKYHPESLLQPEDVAQAACNALMMSRSAEITDLYIRPMRKN
jgi:NADP-dependent 3-hydroxy acid dehydrogenase YdfG